ncbi:MAG: condensation domain-containing protein, partial [Gammaproteobacteria bacterium]
MTEADDMPLQADEYDAFEATASFAQQRLCFLDQLNPGSAAYNINFAIRLKGTLNREALQQALDRLVERHESLRTTFDTVDEEPIQVIREELIIPVEHHEVADAIAEKEKLTELSSRPFNLRKGPLLKPHIIQQAPDNQVLLLVIHHSVADAWSLQVLYGELSGVYSAIINNTEAQLPELPIQYADYAEWQQEWLSGEQLQKQLDYWSTKLGNCAPKLDLPADKPRPRVQSSNGANCSLALDRGLSVGRSSLAKRGSTTLFNAALT